MMSIVAWKHIINHIKANQPTPHSIHISKGLLLTVKGASTRYRIYLGEESKEKADIETENQKAIICNDISYLMMEQDVSECILLAESKKDLAYVMKSNALKRNCGESEKNFELLEEHCSALAEKKKEVIVIFLSV